MFVAAFFASLLLSPLFLQAGLDSCGRASEAYARGDLDRAAQELELCVDENPSDVSWLLRLCAVYQSLGRDDDLYRASLVGIDRFPEDRRFRLTAGIHAAETGELDRSVEVFSGALTRWPDDAAFRENLAQALLLRGMERLDADDNEAAESDLRWSTDLEGTNYDALMNLGRALYNLLRPVEALEMFDRVREMRADYPGVELHRGIVLVTMGRHAEAVEALDGFLAHRSEPEGHYFRGLARKNVGDCRSALEDFDAAMSGLPANADALYESAGCLERLGRVPEAETGYRRAIALAPDRPKFRLALGQLLVRSGRREEGRSVLDEARSSYAGMVEEDRRALSFKAIRPGDADESNP